MNWGTAYGLGILFCLGFWCFQESLFGCLGVVLHIITSPFFSHVTVGRDFYRYLKMLACSIHDVTLQVLIGSVSVSVRVKVWPF